MKLVRFLEVVENVTITFADDTRESFKTSGVRLPVTKDLEFSPSDQNQVIVPGISRQPKSIVSDRNSGSNNNRNTANFDDLRSNQRTNGKSQHQHPDVPAWLKRGRK